MITDPNQASVERIAAITGASSGIGRVYAEKLAAEGYGLLLIARREDRLLELKQELERQHGTGVEVFSADLSREADVGRVAERIRGLAELEVLINNAGFGTMGDFRDVPVERHLEMVRVHIDATIALTHAALPKMSERKRGSIVNVSSMSAFMICPGSVVYGATKAFVKSFSDSLNAELAGTGVSVQALCPGMTHTGFHDTEEFKRFDKSQVSAGLWMSAGDVVDQSLRSLRRKRVICIPGFKNRLLAVLFHLRPIRALAGRAVRKKEAS